jgi:hypothetical protein
MTPRLYIDNCGKDPNEAYILYKDAIKVLGNICPIWQDKFQPSVRSVMLIDSVEICRFFLADRCCLINPWNMLEKFNPQTIAAIFLASSIVHAVCVASLMSNACKIASKSNLQYLSIRAQIRFLEKCHTEKNDIDLSAIIMALRSYL